MHRPDSRHRRTSCVSDERSRALPVPDRPFGSPRGRRREQVRRRRTVDYDMTGSARRRSTAMYAAAMALGTLGLSYASVPLYRAFCQATGFGGTVQERVESKIRKLADRTEKPARFITVEFISDLGANMRWKFVPCQQRMQVQVGETSLATGKNSVPISSQHGVNRLSGTDSLLAPELSAY